MLLTLRNWAIKKLSGRSVVVVNAEIADGLLIGPRSPHALVTGCTFWRSMEEYCLYHGIKDDTAEIQAKIHAVADVG